MKRGLKASAKTLQAIAKARGKNLKITKDLDMTGI